MTDKLLSGADPAKSDLDALLQTLRLTTFARNHAPFADEALRGQHTYQRYLLDLATHELAQRERNCHIQRIRAARFPVLKELADFDFADMPQATMKTAGFLAPAGST